jgi:hypothetical protein
MFLHCWKSYSQFAWGQDELRPQSQAGFNWLGNGLGATIVDSLSTMYAEFILSSLCSIFGFSVLTVAKVCYGSEGGVPDGARLDRSAP